MEADDELKGEGNSYDFGARMYDSRLGRWFAVDPDASKYPSWSPYAFSLNDPIRFNDPDGKNPGDVIAKSLKELKEREGYEIYIDRVTAETMIIKTEVVYDYNDISKEGNRVEYNLRKTSFKIDGKGNLKDVVITNNLIKAEVKETTNFIGIFSYELIENQKGKTNFVEGLTPEYNNERIQQISSDSPIVDSFSNLIAKQEDKVKTGSNGVNNLPYREFTNEEKVKDTGNAILSLIEARYGPPTPYGTSLLPRGENKGEIKFFIPEDEEDKAIKLFNKETKKEKVDVQKS